MIRYTQRLTHDPANGITGDCWRTAIGCLLHWLVGLIGPDDRWPRLTTFSKMMGILSITLEGSTLATFKAVRK